MGVYCDIVTLFRVEQKHMLVKDFPKLPKTNEKLADQSAMHNLW